MVLGVHRVTNYIMKILILFSLFTLIHVNQQSNCLDDFKKYVTRNLSPPESVKSNCEWQYAIIKLKIDKNNRIGSYKFLNAASLDLKDSFKFLKNYKVSKYEDFRNRDIVFCLSIENYKNACMLSKNNFSPGEILGRVLSKYSAQQKANPNTVFLFDILEVSYSFDPIK